MRFEPKIGPTGKIILTLIQQKQAAFTRGVRDNVSPVTYLREHRTITLNIGRRMGHTTALFEMADENDVSIFSSGAWVKKAKEKLPEMSRILSAVDVSRFRTESMDAFRRPAEVIWVDCASSLDMHGGLNGLYNGLDEGLQLHLLSSGEPEPVIVLLG